VLPLGTWRGTKKNVQYNRQQKAFTLQSGASLNRETGPFVSGRSIEIRAQVKSTGEGVIIAQGGEADGYSLYIRNGRLSFTTRIRSTVTTVTSAGKIKPGETVILARLLKTGEITIAGAGVEASGKAAGPMSVQPIDGLQVGSDTGGPVGNYQAPFTFTGELITVDLNVK